ncbi:MAG TPA: KamA family radical SAM protein [Negativicutes bacterium]|jgi:lysine 2,3-aminomutase
MHYIKYRPITDCSLIETSDNHDLAAVASIYPFRLSPFYAGLIQLPGDAIWKQCMPDVQELEDDQHPDPLCEDSLSPVPGLIHRYPNRVVLLVSNQCPVYCRFCMRKRHVGDGNRPLSRDALDKALDYVSKHQGIQDVILSGGDPLMLDDTSLLYVLSRLRAIKHVSIIRIGTRIPVTLPERITDDLCDLLKQFQPLYINTHFNHPHEINPESAAACNRLADAGIPLGNQSVLLKGVNDDIDIMGSLMMKLLELRVRPYYIHQMDLVRGTGHFRTSVAKGLAIIRGLRGYISGMAVPHYVIDLPEGKGKVPILPDAVERVGEVLLLTNYRGERIAYRDITTPQV